MRTNPGFKRSVHVAAACAALGILSGSSARGDVLLSNFEPPLGNGLQGWFNYNGNISALGLVNNPTGGTTNWMSIEYNNLAAWETAGPTIQPWANANFSDATFQGHNFLQFDVIFPADSWLSDDPALPIGINSNGGGNGLLQTIDTTQNDVSHHVVIDYTSYKSSNGGPGNITDWMNLLFGHPDESQWGGNPFAPRAYVDNIYLTLTSTPPAQPPAPNNGTWDPTRSGDWTETANWIGGVAAHGTGNTATFGAAAAPRTVNVNPIGINLGNVVIDGASGYTFTGNGITLQSAPGTPNTITVSGGGSHAMAAISVNQVATDSTVFTVNAAASLTIDNLTGGGFGTYVKEGEGALTVDKMVNVNVTVNGGSVSLKPGGAQANGFIYGLTVSNDSTFNLNGNSVRTNSLASAGTPGHINLGGGMLSTALHGGFTFFGTIDGAGDVIVGGESSTPQTAEFAGNSTYVGSTTVTNGNTLVVSHGGGLGAGSPLTINAASRVNLSGDLASAVRVTALTLNGGAAPDATLDLTNDAMVVDYTGSTPLTALREQIIFAYNNGAWDRAGITTTSGAGYGVGYGEAGALAPVPAIFGTVDATTVLIRGTRYGDANLDGQVNLQDFNRLASNFGASNAGWLQGDFNYDGQVNLQDFNRLASNFGLAAAGPHVTPEDWARLGAAIPEPAGAAVVGAVALLGWRRHRRGGC